MSFKNKIVNDTLSNLSSFKKNVISKMEISEIKRMRKNSFYLRNDLSIFYYDNNKNVFLIVKMDKPIKSYFNSHFSKEYSYFAIDFFITEHQKYNDYCSFLENIDCLPWIISDVILPCLYGDSFVSVVEKINQLLEEIDYISYLISEAVLGDSYLEYYEEKKFCSNYFSETKENTKKNEIKI